MTPKTSPRSAKVTWTPAEVYGIQAAGLRDLAAERTAVGDLDVAHELARLADIQEAALIAERDELAIRLGLAGGCADGETER